MQKVNGNTKNLDLLAKKIKDRDETIERMKDLKAKLSTKMVTKN